MSIQVANWVLAGLRTLLASFDLTTNITVDFFEVSILITLAKQCKRSVVERRWGRQGSIVRDSVYNGKFYDARNDRANWAPPGFSDSLSA